MAFFLSPVLNEQQFDANGNPALGWQIYSYLAGSTTPTATFTSNLGITTQPNPIILNELGLPANPIWIQGGITVKFVVKDASSTVIRVIDNVSGINDASITVSEWISSGFTPTFISTTSFSVPGDQTSILQPSRRIRTLNASGLVYSTILTSVYGAVTTITLANDGTSVLDSGLSKVEYGILSATNPSTPIEALPAFSAYQSTLQSIPNAVNTKVAFQSKEYDTDNAYDAVTLFRFKPLIAKYYQITALVSFVTAPSACLVFIYKNGIRYKDGVYIPNALSASVTADIFLSATDYVEIFAFQNSAGALNTTVGLSQTYFQAHVIRRAN
jgi:hypothetical protein